VIEFIPQKYLYNKTRSLKFFKSFGRLNFRLPRLTKDSKKQRITGRRFVGRSTDGSKLSCRNKFIDIKKGRLWKNSTWKSFKLKNLYN
jgi:hypothetical protein